MKTKIGKSQDNLAVNTKAQVNNPHEEETWKSLLIVERQIEISSLGRVRYEHNKKIIKAFSSDKKDYKQVLIRGSENQGKKSKVKAVHKLVALAFLECDPTINNPTVHHINGKTCDNRAINLVYLSKCDHILLHQQQDTALYLAETCAHAQEPSLPNTFPSPSPLGLSVSIKKFKNGWRKVPGYLGKYWINLEGTIVNANRRIIRAYLYSNRRFAGLVDWRGNVSMHDVDQLVAAVWANTKETESMRLHLVDCC